MLKWIKRKLKQRKCEHRYMDRYIIGGEEVFITHTHCIKCGKENKKHG